MIQSNITISNKLGLHARASAKFVKLAATFDAEVKVAKDLFVQGVNFYAVK